MLDTRKDRIAVSCGTRTVRHLSPGEAFKLSRDLASAAWAMMAVRLSLAQLATKRTRRERTILKAFGRLRTIKRGG